MKTYLNIHGWDGSRILQNLFDDEKIIHPENPKFASYVLLPTNELNDFVQRCKELNVNVLIYWDSNTVFIGYRKFTQH